MEVEVAIKLMINATIDPPSDEVDCWKLFMPGPNFTVYGNSRDNAIEELHDMLNLITESFDGLPDPLGSLIRYLHWSGIEYTIIPTAASFPTLPALMEQADAQVEEIAIHKVLSHA